MYTFVEADFIETPAVCTEQIYDEWFQMAKQLKKLSKKSI